MYLTYVGPVAFQQKGRRPQKAGVRSEYYFQCQGVAEKNKLWSGFTTHLFQFTCCIFTCWSISGFPYTERQKQKRQLSHFASSNPRRRLHLRLPAYCSCFTRPSDSLTALARHADTKDEAMLTSSSERSHRRLAHCAWNNAPYLIIEFSTFILFNYTGTSSNTSPGTLLLSLLLSSCSCKASLSQRCCSLLVCFTS